MRNPGSSFRWSSLCRLIIFCPALESWGLRHGAPPPPPKRGTDCSWATLLAATNAEPAACAVPKKVEENPALANTSRGLAVRAMGNFRVDKTFKSPRRIALVIRGESYRSGVGQGNRNDTITADGWYWQTVASQSHVEKVIKPMEDCGFTVDVFVGTYDHPGNRISHRPIEDLLIHYSPRVRDKLVVPGNKKHVRDGHSKDMWGAGTMYQESFKLLTKHHQQRGATYDAVLVIRHDTIFKQPLLSMPGVDWGKVVFPFLEQLMIDSVSDVLQWFPWRYVNCASECGYHGHGLGACLIETAGTNFLGFMWPGSHTSNTAVEANPIYTLAREDAGEKRTAILVVGDVGRMAPLKAKSRHAAGPYAQMRVTGRSFVEHVLKPNNAHILDPHKHADVFVHGWVPGLEREYRRHFTSIARAEHDGKLKEWESTFKSKLGGGLDDWREVAWAYSVERATTMMRDYEQGRGKKYDRVLIYRPDTVLLSDLDLDAIMTKEDSKEGPVYASRLGSGSSSRHLHFAMGRGRALDFAHLYSRLPATPPRPGKTWISEFVERYLKAELVEDNVTAGVDEEAYCKIPSSLSEVCAEAQLSRMRNVGFTADDARELGLRCSSSV